MQLPRFARLEIQIDDSDDLVFAAIEMATLASELRKIAAQIKEPRLMRLAAHDAIRDTSSRTRHRPSSGVEI